MDYTLKEELRDQRRVLQGRIFTKVDLLRIHIRVAGLEEQERRRQEKLLSSILANYDLLLELSEGTPFSKGIQNEC